MTMMLPANTTTSAVRRLATLVPLLLLGACAHLPFMGGEVTPATSDAAVAPAPDPQALAERAEAMPAARGKYVVVDLDVNELRFMDAERVLWSAPVGTGTGLQLRGEEQEWDFSTPGGVFAVQYKELDPVWHLPDWHFVKLDVPIPPRGSPERRIPGALGMAAVYLGDDIAIHGTDKPHLLGQRVSHGCIRLEDRYALRLFHNVQVGTPVLIVGGEDLPVPDEAEMPSDPAESAPGPRITYENSRPQESTGALLDLLDEQLTADAAAAAWMRTASELIARGVRDDARALRGVLARAGLARDEAAGREYATFLADAFARGSWRAVVSLARIPDDARDRAARVIVEGTLDLYPGSLDQRGVPWPTRRVLRQSLGPEGQSGWEALRAAEEAYRERYADARIDVTAAF